MGGSGRQEILVAEFLRGEWLPATRATVRPTTFTNYTSHVESRPTRPHRTRSTFVRLTLDVYSHAVPHMQKDAAEQIARVMFD